MRRNTTLIAKCSSSVKLVCLLLAVFATNNASAQCARSATNFGTFAANTGLISNSFPAGNYFTFPVLTGGSYNISTCASGFDTELSGWDPTNSSSIFFNDDFGPFCFTTRASLTYTSTFTDNIFVQLTEFPCNYSGSLANISVSQNNNISFTSSSAAMCTGETRTLTATPAPTASFPAAGNSGTFSGTGVSGSVFTAPAVSTPTNFIITYTFGFVSQTQTILVNPIPNVLPVSSQAVCNSAATSAITFGTTIAGTVFNWTNPIPAIGLGASGTGNISSFTALNPGVTPVTSVFTVTPTRAGCVGTAQTFNITVNPTPNVGAVSSQAVCNTAPTSTINFSTSVPGTVFNWTNPNPGIGLSASGISNIGSFIATNAATIPVTAVFTVTPTRSGCVGSVQTFSITVNPTPNVSPVSSQTVCNTVSTSAITFATTVPGTVFNWTNPNPGIGLLGSGTSNIASFTAVNTSFVPVTTVFTVTPTRAGCVGSIQTFSITVNPTPNVVASSNQAVCNGASTTSVIFTGPVAGTTYSWTNDNTSIGLASSGSDSIASFTGTNSTTATIAGNITVSTSANGCSGGSNSFTITVYPTPTLSTTLNPPAICDNTLFSYPPASATTGTAFDWSRDVVAGITNPMNTGSDDPLEILMSDTTDPINVAYVYTLTANGCTNSQTVTVVVNPTPMLTSPLSPAAICDSTEFAYAHTSLTAGTTYSWSRDFVSGISNAAQSGIGDISEYLDNTTPNPIPVVYMDTLMANGCINIQSVTVTVNPKPELSTATVLSAICDSSSIFYVPNSLTTGTTYAWNRAALAGTAAATGIDTISGTLYNNTVNPVTIVHTYTLTANGCTNTQDVSIVVYPTPKLNSSLTPPALCDSQIFNYTPMSGTLGAAFAWSRSFVLGIGVPASSGTGNPNEQMINNTHGNLNVTYVYTTTANGCTHVQHVVVAVRPTPRLSTPLTGAICSGVNYHYKPTGYTFGSTFAWARASVSGITPNTGAGTGVIDEVLVNDTLKPIITAYKFTVTANGCSHTQYVVVTVNPAPAAVGITTYPPAALCANTIGQNFGTSAMPPAGQQYDWTATNATVWSTGEKGQYCLVNFDTPGEAWVTLNSNVTGIACITKSSYKVNVGTSVAGMPKVVYFDGQLVCLDPTQNSYQWGFDDKLTLDSTIVAGEKNPNYFISGPDFVYRHYWVITEKDGCIQKSYYNAPLAISEVSADVANIKLYPNPANSLLNVEIQTTIDGKYELDVVNLLGQTLYKEKVDGQRARVDVTNFAPGIYLVDCYRDGVKIATQRFIKN